MPKEVVFRNIKYELQGGRGSSNYYSNDDGEFLMNNIRVMEELNYEVKLIEEQQYIDIQEIKELDYRVEEIPEDEDYRKMFIESCLQLNKEKINKILQWAKQLDRREER